MVKRVFPHCHTIISEKKKSVDNLNNLQFFLITGHIQCFGFLGDFFLGFIDFFDKIDTKKAFRLLAMYMNILG